MQKNTHDLERRKYKRVSVDAYVLVTLTTDKSFGETILTAKDIGPEGIFLACKECFPVGTILNLRIHTPTTMEPINAQAKVVRISKDQNLNIVGMGLVFIQMDEEARKELLKHLYLAYHYTEINKKAH